MMVIRGLLSALFVPPLPQIALVLLAVFLWGRRRTLARALVGFSLLWLYALSLPVTAGLVASWLETSPALHSPAELSGRQVIVVLGGGRYSSGPEFGGADQPAAPTMQRLRYAALLYRSSGLPILASGGRVHDEKLSEAELMQRAAERDFLVNVRWLETRSRTTHENAVQSANMLLPLGMSRIVLVTHAQHMPRALREFRQAGFDVLPAPTVFYTDGTALPTALRWVPRLSAWDYNVSASHEVLGMVWYRMTAW